MLLQRITAIYFHICMSCFSVATRYTHQVAAANMATIRTPNGAYKDFMLTATTLAVAGESQSTLCFDNIRGRQKLRPGLQTLYPSFSVNRIISRRADGFCFPL